MPLMRRRAELAQKRADRPAMDGTSARQLAAAHGAEVTAAAAEAAHARSEADALREALASCDAELQRMQAIATVSFSGSAWHRRSFNPSELLLVKSCRTSS
jgi:predicted amidophosphoribosyltransferase